MDLKKKKLKKKSETIVFVFTKRYALQHLVELELKPETVKII